MATIKERELQSKKDAITAIKKFLGKEPTIYTVVHHVSRSGMSRRISAYCAYKGTIIKLDWYIQQLGTFKQHKDGGLMVGGCGMDMGFHLVYTTSRQVYTSKRNTADAGYKITQRWM